MAALLVTPVDRQQHIGLGVRETIGRQSALCMTKVDTIGRLGSKIKRVRMLDSVCLLQLLGKAFHPN